MNAKLVLWGMDAQDEKILIALELLVKENKVKILTFPDKIVIDDFYDKMRNDWRVGKEVELLEGHQEEIRDLTASETLLPDHIKVERTDLIERKQLEWHVLVLGSKMNEQFKSELDSIKEKVENLEVFDSAQWEGLKTFWNKVQNQVRDGILSRGYANELKKTTDDIFEKLKNLRKKLDEEYRSKAKENFTWFSGKLDDVEKRIEEGLKLSGVFDDLKELQNKFRTTKLTREFRDKIWARIDGSFKAVKEKKYGKKASNGNSALSRLNNRYEGLVKAIQRSEYSRDRDLKDLKFEKMRIEKTDGQLEAQIREAKIKMINQRLKFKEEKLQDMHATKLELEKKMAKLQEKAKLDKIRQEKAAAAKEKIKAEAQQSGENLDADTKEKLAAAAEKINEAKKKKKKKKPIIEKVKDAANEIVEIVEEKVEDAIISAKAAAIVISEEVSEKIEPLAEKGKEVVEDLTNKASEKAEEVKQTFASSKEDAKDNDDPSIMDKVKDLAENIKDTIHDAVEDMAEKIEPYTEKGKEIVEDIVEKATGIVDDVKEKAEEVMDSAQDEEVLAEDISDDATNPEEDVPPADA